MPESRTRQVLLAEDDPELARMFELSLSLRGWGVSVTADGEEAWAALTAERDRFCLLVTDLLMPRLSGVELIRRILDTEGSAPPLGIILLTGLPTDADDLAAVRADPSCVVVPKTDATLPGLDAAIGAVLNDHGSRDDHAQPTARVDDVDHTANA